MHYQISKQVNRTTNGTTYALFNVFASGKVAIGSYAKRADAKRAGEALLMKGDTLTTGKPETYSLYA